MARWRLNLFLGLSISLSACERPITEDLSQISIRAPDHRLLGKAGSLSSIPSDRKACYGIIVTGSGIPVQKPNSCSPESGVLGGFVESGQSLKASVPKGSQRKIELLLYLMAVGDNGPCPELKASFSSDLLSKTFIVGSTTVDLTLQEQNVEITASFPGETNTIASQLSLPDNCKTQSTGNLKFSISAANGLATGSTNKLYGRAGRGEENLVLSGSNNKLHVRE